MIPQMRLLLVEDEKGIADILKSGLEAESFCVDTALDGERGLFLARTNNYRLIILDYMLPKLNGREICKRIRQEEINVPILMLTVRTKVADKVDLLDLGADDYVTKPFLFDELMARIRALIRRPPRPSRDNLSISDLTLDRISYSVRRGGRDIYLTRKEFILLEYFIEHQGQVLSSDEIMGGVWDMDVDPFSKTVKMHIMNLRRKIDKDHEQKLIHTVPGRGYKICES